MNESRSAGAAPASIAPAEFTPLGSKTTPVPRRRLRPAAGALAGALLLFAGALWFLFTARSVELQIEPAASEVRVSGGLRLALGGRLLLRPGEFMLRVEAQGYHPLATSLVVSRESSQRFAFTLAPLPGIIDFLLEPENASVRVDGELIGSGPLRDVDIEEGPRQLEITAERYLPSGQLLQVTGRRVRQQVEIVLEPAWAQLNVITRPPGASLLIDGEPFGVTPANIEVLQGERQLLLQLDRFADHVAQITVVAGQNIDLGAIDLQPANSRLQLRSRPSGANVTVSGEYRGQTPLLLELTPDQAHQLTLSRPGYARASRSVTLAPAAEEALEISLTAQLGEVRIQVEPPEAEIFVDGNRVGSGSQTLSLPAFEQTIEARLSGHATFRQRLTPRPGLEQLLTIALQTETAAQRSALDEEGRNSLNQTLRLLRPGSFSMGASRREPGRRANEVLRPVTLQRWFYLQTTEVTNQQYRQFDPEHNSGQVQGNSLNGDDQPVVRITWLQAAQFCNWLSDKEGLPHFYQIAGGQVTGINVGSTGYRLPTEAEWEWAARTGANGELRFPWGEEFPPAKVAGNFADTSASRITGRFLSGYNDGFAVTAPVGSFAANARGLHDMGGNTAEWVHDFYSIPTAGSEPEVDPMGPSSGTDRVIRGASWAHGTVTELRLAFRDYGLEGRDDVGFRVARHALPE